MSDLISRSTLIEELDKYEKELRKDKTEAIETDDENMLFAIMNQLTAICRIKRNTMNLPTAYDIDKVVEELEKELSLADKEKERCTAENNLQFDTAKGYASGISTAVEIVKQGGITYDCNNCANYTEPDEIDNGCYLCCKGYENNYKPKADNGGVPDDVCEWYVDGDMAINPHNLGRYKIKQYDGLYALDTCQHCKKKIKVVE